MRKWRSKLRRRSVLAFGTALWVAAPLPGHAASLYHIDQRYGTIEFSVSTLGMFDVQGRFPNFHGDLLLDLEHPERSQIGVTIDGSAVEMPLQDQTDLLRSDAYFDVAHHPTERFASTSVQALSPTHYLIRGTLRIRGITQPQDLDATLRDRHVDEARGVEVADFVVKGEVRRSAFGMVADRAMVSDTISLDIGIHLDVGLAR